MGVAGSTAKVCNLTQQELDGFVGTSHFSAAEVKALWVQFASLGKADGGSEILLNRADFQTAVGMKNSTFVDRLFAVFDENDDGAINFSEFLTILSVLSTKALPAEKLEVSFKIYDMDKDGKIGRDELATMLRATMDEHDLVLDDILAVVIDNTRLEMRHRFAAGLWFGNLLFRAGHRYPAASFRLTVDKPHIDFLVIYQMLSKLSWQSAARCDDQSQR